MRDIEAATGEDLGSDRVGKKGKGKGKKKYPNLSDLKQSANTSRSRLERKVFNKYVTPCTLTQLDHLQQSSSGIPHPTIPIMQLASSMFNYLETLCLSSRSAMRRVAQVMSKCDKRKHEKFSNQFNYALN